MTVSRAARMPHPYLTHRAISPQQTTNKEHAMNRSIGILTALFTLIVLVIVAATG